MRAPKRMERSFTEIKIEVFAKVGDKPNH